MRRGTFYVLPTALFLLGAGCLSPTTTPEEPPKPDTPLGLVETFEWCYDHQDEALYAKILDPGFTYILDREQDGRPEHLEWGREEELAYFAELCAACGEGDIDLTLDTSECGDTEPDPGDTEFIINNVAYTLRVLIGDMTYAVAGRFDFRAAKNPGEGPCWRLLVLVGFERLELP
ncbi:MAG TPA: hypothetical protein VM054_06590 [bacterium]|nr:hypothetical protein [bacterium]